MIRKVNIYQLEAVLLSGSKRLMASDYLISEAIN